MLLRYGWGLEPKQVCGLIAGLSPRAYRKEITRGVDELAERAARARERPMVRRPRADAQGVRRRRRRGGAASARRELTSPTAATCSDFVARLGGHLHDLGGSAAAMPTAIDGLERQYRRSPNGSARFGRSVDGAAPRRTGRRGAATRRRSIQVAVDRRAPGRRGRRALECLPRWRGLGRPGKVALACVGRGDRGDDGLRRRRRGAVRRQRRAREGRVRPRSREPRERTNRAGRPVLTDRDSLPSQVGQRRRWSRLRLAAGRAPSRRRGRRR